MTYRVLISNGALRDLEEFYDWIAEHDSPAKADYVLDRLTQTAQSVAALPYRGSRPRELPPGMHAEYRQVFFKPYRVIYEVAGTDVVVHLVVDGRRNMQSLLLRRLTVG
jgi:toxin ParE1/3/4